MVDIDCNPLVKDVHFPIPQFALNFWIFPVSGDSTMQLTNIFVAFTHHPAREFLTADSTSTVDDNAFVHEFFLVITDPLWQLTEIADVWTNSATEVSKIVLVVIPSIKDNGIFVERASLNSFGDK